MALANSPLMPTTMDAPAHTPDRLRRAWQLVTSGRVRPIGPQQCLVAGNVERVYTVDLTQDPPCTCKDQEYRAAKSHGQCKHSLASRLALKDPALLLSLIAMMEFKEQERDE